MTAVLIADDEPVSRRLLQATLQRRGYDVEVAHDGQEALESLLRDTAPRLAVLDCTRSLEERVKVLIASSPDLRHRRASSARPC